MECVSCLQPAVAQQDWGWVRLSAKSRAGNAMYTLLLLLLQSKETLFVFHFWNFLSSSISSQPAVPALGSGETSGTSWFPHFSQNFNSPSSASINCLLKFLCGWLCLCYFWWKHSSETIMSRNDTNLVLLSPHFAIFCGGETSAVRSMWSQISSASVCSPRERGGDPSLAKLQSTESGWQRGKELSSQHVKTLNVCFFLKDWKSDQRCARCSGWLLTRLTLVTIHWIHDRLWNNCQTWKITLFGKWVILWRWSVQEMPELVNW